MDANQPSHTLRLTDLYFSGQRVDKLSFGRSPLKPQAIPSAIASSFACFMLATLPSHAQETTSRLLPPPPQIIPVSDLDRRPVPGNFSDQQEAVFQAPTNLQPSSATQYLVYVNGDSPLLLQQVRAVEPGAFIHEIQGRRVIQAGTFSNETNARQQINALSQQGIAGEMTAQKPIAYPNLNRSNRYLVVVPASREVLPTLTRQAVRLGIRLDAIQQKDAPLGPHLEVGPFAEHSQAEAINRYLRSAGMDARVYFR